MSSRPLPTPGSVDWDALRQRLAALEAQLADGGALGSAAEAQTLRARAQQLAQAGATTAAPVAQTLEVLEFQLAHERYALETRYVREVYPLRELTPLPGTPPFVLGLVNVRGQIISVNDLKQFFELPAAGLTDLNKVILLAGGGMYFGVLADQIFEVRALPTAQLQAGLPTAAGPRAEFTLGLTPERTIILDAGRLLASPALLIHDDAES